MGPIFLLSLALQIACCVHVVRTGRPLYWVFILLVFSYLAVAVYVLAEILPELRSGRTGQRMVRQVRNTLDPGRVKREAGARLKLSDTPDNRRKLAEESLRTGDFAQAESLYRGALKGLYAHDPDLMLGLAQAQYGLGQPQQTRQTLDALIAANPGYRSPTGHLLYARAVEDSGEVDEALHEYESLARGYAGEEARVRYGLLLRKAGRTEQATAQFRETLDRAQASPAFYRKEQRAWIDVARRELATLTKG